MIMIIIWNPIARQNLRAKLPTRPDISRVFTIIVIIIITSAKSQYQVSRQSVTFFVACSVGNNSQWLLCHRASTHGWAAKTFHDRCDNKIYTVIIIKNGQYVFGGYTDVPWGKYNFPETKKQPCSYFDLDLFALLSLLTVSVIVIAFSYCFLFFLLFLHSFENRIIIP